MTVRELDKGIAETVSTFTDPLVVFNVGWADTIPKWLKDQIILERLIENMRLARGEKPTGTDAEATAYLYTASLCFPPSQEWAKIYFYVAGREMRKAKQGVELPEDIKVEKLTDYELQKLEQLKAWIYDQRGKARKERQR